MNCVEAETLIDALLDGELDAGHAREVEAHVATCARCAARLSAARGLRDALAGAELRFAAPPALRARIDAALPRGANSGRMNRRSLLAGFAGGAAASAAAATALLVFMRREDRDQTLTGELVAAHLRSLQAEHLTDVQSTDQHAVKPWFNGRLDLAPPVADLTAQGFTLIGGRLDYIEGRPAAALVYRRRQHVINLFVMEDAGAGSRPAVLTQHGYNLRSWSDGGVEFWAVSDINADELKEFQDRYVAATRPSAG